MRIHVLICACEGLPVRPPLSELGAVILLHLGPVATSEAAGRGRKRAARGKPRPAEAHVGAGFDPLRQAAAGRLKTDEAGRDQSQYQHTSAFNFSWCWSRAAARLLKHVVIKHRTLIDICRLCHPRRPGRPADALKLRGCKIDFCSLPFFYSFPPRSPKCSESNVKSCLLSLHKVMQRSRRGVQRGEHSTSCVLFITAASPARQSGTDRRAGTKQRTPDSERV